MMLSARFAPLLGAVALASCNPHAPPEQRVIYVSDERGNAVLVVDPATGKMLRHIPAGTRPRGIRLSPDGATLYVAVSGSPLGGPGVDEASLPPADRSRDGIAVIDTATGAVTRVLKAGTDPETFALSPDGRTLYVSNEDASRVSAVDTRGIAPTRQLPVGEEPEGSAVTLDGKRLFVACEASDLVMVFDLASMRRIAAVPVAGRPRTVLASADGRSVLVAVENGGALVVLSATDGAVQRRIDLAAGDPKLRPMGLAEARDGRSVFVTTGRAGAVLEVDPVAGKVIRRIGNVGARPWGVALAGGRLVTANGPSGDLAFVDIASGKVVARPKVGVGPWGIAASPDKH